MKKVSAIILIAVVIFCFYGCGKKDVLLSNKTDYPQSSENSMSTNMQGEYKIYGNQDQNIFIHRNIDSGSFDNPHKIGDSVHLRHSEINTGYTYLNDIFIYDYNITFEQVLSGNDAIEKLRKTANNFNQEKHMLENNDLYLVKIKIQYNSDSQIKDVLPGSICLTAVNSQGKYISDEHRFNSEYSRETVNGEVSNWYELLVPKNESFVAVFAVGSPMEYPGLINVAYFDIQNN